VDFAVLKNTPTNQSGVAHGEEGKCGVRFALLGRKEFEVRAVERAVATKNDEEKIIVSRFLRI
jgi:hypothetical protein